VITDVECRSIESIDPFLRDAYDGGQPRRLGGRTIGYATSTRSIFKPDLVYGTTISVASRYQVLPGAADFTLDRKRPVLGRRDVAERRLSAKTTANIQRIVCFGIGVLSRKG
jgi:hypothetical protein